jgi:hypothetical protein
MSSPKITDTSKQHPAIFLMEAAVAYRNGGDASNAILDQESRGQRELVAAAGSLLPATGTINDSGGTWFEETPMEELWKLYGVKIGEPVEGDEIWVRAELPQGWHILATDHSMWTKLVDNKGRIRARIFYKAASYDREAFIQPERRFAASTRYEEEGDRTSPCFGIVLDNDREVRRLGPFSNDYGERPKHGTKYFDDWKSGYQKGLAAAEAWLTENYPDWNTIWAYWD